MNREKIVGIGTTADEASHLTVWTRLQIESGSVNQLGRVDLAPQSQNRKPSTSVRDAGRRVGSCDQGQNQ